MKLEYLLEPAYDNLLNNISSNRELYLGTEEWLTDYFSNRPFSQESTLELPKPDLFMESDQLTDADKSIEDLTNVRFVYDAFKKLDPLQATNKYLWTYLSHCLFPKYIKHRWKPSSDGTILSRFFVTGQSKSLTQNAISRLWWYGHLTYDDDASDKYHLTKTLLINQTVCTDFVDTVYSRNRTVGKGVLLALAEFNSILRIGEGITQYFRDFNKYFNRYGAVTVVDVLSSEEVYNIALEYLMKLRN